MKKYYWKGENVTKDENNNKVIVNIAVVTKEDRAPHGLTMRYFDGKMKRFTNFKSATEEDIKGLYRYNLNL